MPRRSSLAPPLETRAGRPRQLTPHRRGVPALVLIDNPAYVLKPHLSPLATTSERCLRCLQPIQASRPLASESVVAFGPRPRLAFGTGSEIKRTWSFIDFGASSPTRHERA